MSFNLLIISINFSIGEELFLHLRFYKIFPVVKKSTEHMFFTIIYL